MTVAFDISALKRRVDQAPDGAGLRPIGLKSALVGEGALESLADAVGALVIGGGRPGPVAILSDLTPKRYRGGELLEYVTKSVASIAGVRGVFVGSKGHNVHADESTVAKATLDCEGASCLVAVGSGTVADIGKVIAAAHGLGYVIVQTADSVNGFADDRSVLLVNGVKRTVPSTWADVIVADVDVLVDAPAAMNAAGLADLIAMFTAPADWYLANLLGMDDSYSPTVVALAREQGPALLESARFVPAAGRDALCRIAATLTLSGISMGIAGTTAPCSGMEHAVSHLLEMAAVKSGGEAGLHGAQVGVSSIVAACLWQRVLDELDDGGLSRVLVPDATESEARVKAAFCGVDPSGEMAEECWHDYRRKLARWAQARERVALAADQWPSHSRALSHLLAPPESITAALRSAGAPASFGELEPSVEESSALWALTSCNLMRDRFSVADMACFLGIWDEDLVAEIFDRARELGAMP